MSGECARLALAAKRLFEDRQRIAERRQVPHDLSKRPLVLARRRRRLTHERAKGLAASRLRTRNRSSTAEGERNDCGENDTENG